jgi:hypothetical protein
MPTPFYKKITINKQKNPFFSANKQAKYDNKLSITQSNQSIIHPTKIKLATKQV